jgi:hypothetical protein
MISDQHIDLESILSNPKEQIFILAYAEDAEHIAYFDSYGNKYIARGGTLAWRINNPGLLLSRSHVAGQNGSIGSYNSYAIFANPEKGHQALSDWLHLKKYYNSPLKTIAKHYQPRDPEGFILKLIALVNLPTDQKLKSFSKTEFEHLVRAIAKEHLSSISLESPLLGLIHFYFLHILGVPKFEDVGIPGGRLNQQHLHNYVNLDDFCWVK